MKKTVSALSPARSKSQEAALESAGVCARARSPLIEGGVDGSQLQDNASKLDETHSGNELGDSSASHSRSA